jgi:hypothetical protein
LNFSELGKIKLMVGFEILIFVFADIIEKIKLMMDG